MTQRAAGSSDGRFASLAARHWEAALYLAIVAIALVLRLWNLDARAFQHDESKHVYYAWRLFMLRSEPGHVAYEHTPALHGPFQFFGTALMFRLFGDSDFTARLLYALFGTAIVALPYLLRQALGRWGALLASLMLALSPTMLYFSRFARDDVITAFATFALAIAIWRYLSERRQGFLMFAAAALMLGMLTKEVIYASCAMFLLYLDWQLANDFVDRIRSTRPLDQQQAALAWAALLPTAWLIAALWPLLGSVRHRWSLGEALPPAGDLIVLLGTLVLLPLAPLVQELPFVDNKGLYQLVAGGENELFWGSFVVLAVGSAIIGLLWNRRLWPVAALIVYVPYVTMYTTLFTNMAGFKSGMWGSMDFWMELQFGGGANQLQYYYPMLTSVYEFLPMLFALGGALYYAYRGDERQQVLTSAVLTIVTVLLIIPGGEWRITATFLVLLVGVLLLAIDGFTKLLLFWSLFSLWSLTAAHEKAPWLEVHLALPVILLAARGLNDIASGVADALRRGTLTRSMRSIGQIAALAVFALLLAFTARASFVAAYDQGDPDGNPPELLMWAQGNPRLIDLRDEIDALSGSSLPCGRVIVAIDSQGFWPWPWYLRDYDFTVLNPNSDRKPAPGAVVLVSDDHRAKFEPSTEIYDSAVAYTHSWTFPDMYRDLHTDSFIGGVLRGDYWNTWRTYYFDRQINAAPPAPQSFAYFPNDQSSDQAPAAACAAGPPAPEPLTPDAQTLDVWAREHRPEAPAMAPDAVLHLPGADLFAQDWENTTAAIARSGGREASCAAARDSTTGAWKFFLQRIVVGLGQSRLDPIQLGDDADIETARRMLLAACDWSQT